MNAINYVKNTLSKIRIIKEENKTDCIILLCNYREIEEKKRGLKYHVIIYYLI